MKESVTYLDCETFESTLASLAILFDCTPDVMAKKLESIKPSEIEEEAENFFDERLDALRHRLGKHAHPDRVWWFHSTRTLPSNTFERGLLPLKVILPEIWEVFFNIFKGTATHEKLLDLQKSGQLRPVLKNRLRQADYGPFALLVKELINEGDHRFVELPESVKDICGEFREIYGEDIETRIKEVLRPCKVKFYSDYKANPHTLDAAISYAYLKVWDDSRQFKKLRWFYEDQAQAIFNGKGAAITPEQILKVEFV